MPPNPKTLARLEHLSLDLLQLGLDLVGIVDPTPISDGANALISLARRDYWGAGISAVSAFPYIGDLAKVGKLGKYQKSVKEALELAKESEDAYSYLAPFFAKIKLVLDKLRPGSNEGFVGWLKREIDDFFKVAKHSGKEIVKPFRSLEAARKEALDILERYVGPIHPRYKVELGRLEKSALYEKEIGVSYHSADGSAWGQIRIDYDHGKGPHYNLHVKVKGVDTKYAFCFPGNEELIKKIAKSRNPR